MLNELNKKSLETEIKMIGEQTAGEAAKARKQVEKVISSANSSMFDIADLLYNVKKHNYYSGYNTFTEYLKSLKFKESRLRYLVRMAETMEALGINRGTYEPVGLSKLRAITSLDVNGTWKNPETDEEIPLKAFIKGFIDKGKDMTLAEIQQHVRTLKGEIGDEAFVILHIKIKQGALDKVVRPALELIKMKIGSVKKDEEGISLDASDGRCLELMAAEILNDPLYQLIGENEYANKESNEEAE